MRTDFDLYSTLIMAAITVLAGLVLLIREYRKSYNLRKVKRGKEYNKPFKEYSDYLEGKQ